MTTQNSESQMFGIFQHIINDTIVGYTVRLCGFGMRRSRIFKFDTYDNDAMVTLKYAKVYRDKCVLKYSEQSDRTTFVERTNSLCVDGSVYLRMNGFSGPNWVTRRITVCGNSEHPPRSFSVNKYGYAEAFAMARLHMLKFNPNMNIQNVPPDEPKWSREWIKIPRKAKKEISTYIKTEVIALSLK